MLAKCSKFEEILARYLHGGVLLQEREELEKHLSVCPDCERLYGEIAAIDHTLREMPGKQVDPPPFLRARILSNLEDPERAPAWRRWGRWAAAFGAAAACGLLAVALQRGSVTETPRVASVPAPSQAVEPSPPPKAPEPKVAALPPRPAPKVRIIREVKIYFYYPPAARVAVTGDFNGWNPEGVPLKASGKPGLWETTLRLSPGAYSYNFIVDGNVLLPDPNAPDQMPDGYGGTNSILLVKGGNSV
jgi:hypothetical protein